MGDAQKVFDRMVEREVEPDGFCFGFLIFKDFKKVTTEGD